MVLLNWLCMIITFSTSFVIANTANHINRSENVSHTNNTRSEPKIVNLRCYNVYEDQITVSGFSSGGTMAQTMQIAHSSLFRGVATFSHSYYRCGPGTGKEEDYDDACTIVAANRTYDPDLVLADIRKYERQGLIDSTDNLLDKRFYLYAGMRSPFFDLNIALTAVRIFEPLIKDAYAIKTRVQDASQVLPTDKSGPGCTEPPSLDTYFVANCGFSGAYAALRWLHGKDIRRPNEYTRVNLDNLIAFNQAEFFKGVEGNPLMDKVGYIYVPQYCRFVFKTCHLHFYFHGCQTGREYNGTNHLVQSGFLEVAEANEIILVAPQAIGNQENSIGCWDTYGLTGKLYATKQGAQVKVVRNILARILGEY